MPLEATLVNLLIAARAVHFAASMLVAGALSFSVLVAQPIWHGADLDPDDWVQRVHTQVAWVVGLALALAVASGVVQLVLIAAAVSEQSWADVIGGGVAWTFARETHFGAIAQFRLALAVVLAGLLLPTPLALSRADQQTWVRLLAALVAAFFLGSLAWTGHAAGATGLGANTHLLADLVHTLAAGAWVGGLVPLALVLRLAGQSGDGRSLAACGQTLRRFSTLGVVSVSALLASGLVNTWYLTNRMRELFGTEYGWLVQIKIALFLAMLGLAAINRLWLTPAVGRVEDGPERQRIALLRLRCSTTLEIAIGLLVIYMVGVLGMTPPAGHNHD